MSTYLQCVVCLWCTPAPLEVSEEVSEDKLLVARLDAGAECVGTAGDPERRRRLLHRCIVAVTAEEKKSGEGVIEEEMVLTKPFIERKKSGKKVSK